jgi:hypothetical protein
MKNRNKYKITGQMSRQTADPQANVSIFLFFPTAHFLNTNKRSDSRVPVKDKLNKRVILASRTNDTFAFARAHKAYPSAKAKEPFFANAPLNN